MLTHAMDDAPWEARIAQLGQVVDLEASARGCGALRRRRQVRSAAGLLRLCLAYVLGRLSLRGLSAWAAAQGWAAHPRPALGGLGTPAAMSDVAILKRLRASADWLGALAAALLAERYPEAVAGTGEQRLVVVDATTVVPPGDKRDYWLVHTVFDLTDLRFRVVEVTGRSEPERLARGGVRAGEVRLADRGHARADDLALVVAGGADFLVRAAANYPRLVDQTGCPLDRLALCRQATRERPADQPVVVSKGKSSTGVVARLVVIPLEPEAAQRARERARRNARHWGYRASEAAVEMAGYLMLLTSLPVETWPALRVLTSYRLRWQVELAFKRMKSLVGLEALRAKDPDLARAWINTALLAALLTDADADLTAATAEPGEEDEDDPVAFAKGPAISP
jgi:Transposase DDE domain